jgi:perosamine synthetase
VQLDKLDSLVRRRRSTAAQLDEVIGSFAGNRLPRTAPGVRHAYHLYTFFLGGPPGAREDLVRALDRRGVQVELRYFPLHLLPEWRWHGPSWGECPVAERLWFREHVNLPCHPGLSDAQVRYLVEVLGDCLAEATGDARLAAR